MEVRAMCRVVIRPEESPEIAASFRLQSAQKRPVGSRAPAFFDADPSAVPETHAGDIDGISTRVPTQGRLVAVIYVSARVAADMIDDAHRLSVRRPRGRL